MLQQSKSVKLFQRLEEDRNTGNHVKNIGKMRESGKREEAISGKKATTPFIKWLFVYLSDTLLSERQFYFESALDKWTMLTKIFDTF